MFHRVDDIYSMWAPDFLRKAYRIAAYDGMLTKRVEAQRATQGAAAAPAPAVASAPPAGSSPRPPARSSRPAAGKLPAGARVVPDAAMALMMPGLFDRRRVSAGDN